MRVVEIKKKNKKWYILFIKFYSLLILIVNGQLKMPRQEHLPEDVPVPILYNNLPIDSKITDIEIINYCKQIRVDATVKPNIKHQGFFYIPDNYTLEIFEPDDENVLVLFWRYGIHVKHVHCYDILKQNQTQRVSSG